MKNIGRFYVANSFFHDLRPGDGVNLFHRLIIFETANNLATQRTEYLGMHEDFKDVLEGAKVPEYKPVFDKKTGIPRWVKVD